MPTAAAALQRRGYAPVPRDDTRAWNFVLGDDVPALCERFGIPVPREYLRFR